MAEPWTPPDRWLKPREAAHRAGYSAETIRGWEASKGLVTRRDWRGHRQYLASSLEAILTARETPGSASW
jgi:DNA-binding transcriptional MerR regulator